MLQKIITRILEPRHFWRSVGFDELSELYTSQLLRSLGISLVGLFTPIYLYKLGYSISDIALFHVFWFLPRPLMDLFWGRVVGWIGPKHSMLMSSFIHVVYLGAVLTIKDLGWPLFVPAFLGSAAYGLHLLAVSVDFSKVKHADHGGKELGYLDTVQKVGGVVGPLIGGLIANYLDPRYTIALAMVVLLCSTIPLFLSMEAVKTKQRVTYRGMDYRAHLRDYIVAFPATIENVVSQVVWPIYCAIFILKQDVFAKLGIITAVSTGFSLLIIHRIGQLIDHRKGRSLLRTSLVVNSIIHLGRLFVQTPLSVLGTNIANETVTAGYRMPYMKGVFDAADSLPGYRIAYLAVMSAANAIAYCSLWIGFYFLANTFEPKSVFLGVFVLAAVSSYGIMLERYKALDGR